MNTTTKPPDQPSRGAAAHRRRPHVTLTAALALGVAACSVSAGFKKTVAEREVESKIAEQVTKTIPEAKPKVDCPHSLDSTTGSTVTCHVVMGAEAFDVLVTATGRHDDVVDMNIVTVDPDTTTTTG